jgi:hypothetical protein
MIAAMALRLLYLILDRLLSWLMLLGRATCGVPEVSVAVKSTETVDLTGLAVGRAG